MKKNPTRDVHIYLPPGSGEKYRVLAIMLKIEGSSLAAITRKFWDREFEKRAGQKRFEHLIP